jgi:ribosomal protein S18 acetylase RimI-like enzyme
MEHKDKIQAIKENLWHLYHTVSGHLALPSKSTGAIHYSRSKPSPWPDFIYGTDLNKLAQDQTADIISGMEQGELPPFWITSPDCPFLESPLPGLLGLKLVMKWPAMICRLPSGKSFQVKNLVLNQMENATDMAQWFAFVQDHLFNGKIFEEKYHGLQQATGLQFYAAMQGPNIVSTAMIFKDGITAGLYMVAVDQKMRGHGVGTWMVQNLMKRLYANNIAFVVLEANNNSELFYRKIGFENVGNFEIYWKFGLF